MLPKIFVIIPVFNGAEYIQRAISSAFMAGADKVLVVDDGSEDDTVEKVKKLASENVELMSQENKGEAAAVNKGVEKLISILNTQKFDSEKTTGRNTSKGRFVAILSHDDVLLENSLISLADILRKEPMAQVAYGNWNIVSEEGLITQTKTPCDFAEEQLVGRQICIPSVGSLIKIETIQTLSSRGYQLRNPKIRFLSDLEQWFRLSSIGPFLKVEMTVGNWTDHPKNATKINDHKALYRDYLMLLRHLEGELSSNRPSRVVKLAKSNLNRKAAILHSSYGQSIDGKFFWTNSLRHLAISIWLAFPNFLNKSGWKSREFFGVLVPYSARLHRIMKN